VILKQLKLFQRVQMGEEDANMELVASQTMSVLDVTVKMLEGYLGPVRLAFSGVVDLRHQALWPCVVL
jgi:hypothetical protein